MDHPDPQLQIDKNHPATRQMTSRISQAEHRFLRLETKCGFHESVDDAKRYYFRLGLKAAGVLEDALSC